MPEEVKVSSILQEKANVNEKEEKDHCLVQQENQLFSFT